MKLKLAKKELNLSAEIIEIDKIRNLFSTNGYKIIYFDKDNSHKAIMDLVDELKKDGLSIYHREVKYGLDDNSYIYEVTKI